jgi:hypothetical protein
MRRRSRSQKISGPARQPDATEAAEPAEPRSGAESRQETAQRLYLRLKAQVVAENLYEARQYQREVVNLAKQHGRPVPDVFVEATTTLDYLIEMVPALEGSPSVSQGKGPIVILDLNILIDDVKHELETRERIRTQHWEERKKGDWRSAYWKSCSSHKEASGRLS